MQVSMNKRAWIIRSLGHLSRKSAMQSLLLTFLAWFAGPTPSAAHMQAKSVIVFDALPVTQLQTASGIHLPASAVSADLVNPQHGKVHERSFTETIHFGNSESPKRRKR
jgi:hypothetical protein